MNQSVDSLTQTQIASIWRRVYKTDTHWLWQGTKDSDGYGKYVSVKVITLYTV